MKVTQEVKDLCEAEITRCLEIAAKQWPNHEFDRPRIDYDLRGRTAGTANLSRNVIRLNPILLMENVEEMTTVTTAHELAHLIVFEKDGIERSRSGKRIIHGPAFKNVMRVFGRNGSTTHNMDTSTATVRKVNEHKIHHWACGCGKGIVELGTKRHNRQLNAAPSGFGFYARGHSPKTCGVYSYLGTQAALNAKKK